MGDLRDKLEKVTHLGRELIEEVETAIEEGDEDRERLRKKELEIEEFLAVSSIDGQVPRSLSDLVPYLQRMTDTARQSQKAADDWKAMSNVATTSHKRAERKTQNLLTSLAAANSTIDQLLAELAKHDPEFVRRVTQGRTPKDIEEPEA